MCTEPRRRFNSCPILLTAEFGRLEMMMKITVEAYDKTKKDGLYYEDHGGEITVYLRYGENMTVVGTTGVTNSACIGYRAEYSSVHHKPFSGKVILES